MKKSVKSLLLIGLIISLSVLSCEDSEHSFFPAPGDAAVIISLNMPPENPSAHENTIWNRIRQFFVPNAVAQTAPAAFSSILVRASSGGATLVQNTFSPTQTLTLNVPAGSGRQIEVTATVTAGDPSAALSFRGAATVDLTGGSTTTVPITMRVNETKIVVPDYRFSQIVQIDNFSAPNWKTNQLGYGSGFNPYDIDFDARGRIYIARYTATDNRAVVRINNINSSTYDAAIVTGILSVGSIAIDRTNHLLYYSTTSAVYRTSCDGGAVYGPFPNTTSVNTIYGMAYDEAENVLYITGTVSLGGPIVIKYNLNTQTVAATTTSGILSAPWHALVKRPYIYIANLNGANGYRIVQFDTNLNYIAGSGNVATSINIGKNMFYGPRRFVAILNRRMTIIDDDDTNDIDKLISMNDLYGDGWETYGRYNYTAGESYFKFYVGT